MSSPIRIPVARSNSSASARSRFGEVCSAAASRRSEANGADHPSTLGNFNDLFVALVRLYMDPRWVAAHSPQVTDQELHSAPVVMCQTTPCVEDDTLIYVNGQECRC